MPESIKALNSRKRSISSRNGSNRRSNCTCSSGSEGTSVSARYFDQGDFKRRQRQRTIQPVPALLPLPRHSRMTVEERRNEIGLVAVDVARFTASHKIPQQSLRHFRIRIRRQRLPHHCGRYRHIQQMQPAIHARQRSRQFPFGMAKRVLIETARNGDIPAERVSHELLVEALNRRQNS